MDNQGVLGAILSHVLNGGGLTLFLDYDGTLVPIAPTPAEALPDAPLLDLLGELAGRPSIRTIILSGRPVAELQRMLPVPGLILCGLYGVEAQIDGNVVLRGPATEGVINQLDQLRDQWTKLVGGLPGFLLEDKGYAVALHARWAEGQEASRVLAAAREQADQTIDFSVFRALDGERYFEIAPLAADKGETVDWILNEVPVAMNLPVAFGDDNKDEAAFAVIHRRGGYAIGVDWRYPLPGVDARLDSPADVRDWLRRLAKAGPQNDD